MFSLPTLFSSLLTVAISPLANSIQDTVLLDKLAWNKSLAYARTLFPAIAFVFVTSHARSSPFRAPISAVLGWGRSHSDHRSTRHCVSSYFFLAYFLPLHPPCQW